MQHLAFSVAPVVKLSYSIRNPSKLRSSLAPLYFSMVTLMLRCGSWGAVDRTCASWVILPCNVWKSSRRPPKGADEGEAAVEARNPGVEEDPADDEEGESHGVTQGTRQRTWDGIGWAGVEVVEETGGA